MGLMLEGVYHPQDPAPDSETADRYRRNAGIIRHWIPLQDDGSPAPETRLHLYAAWNCPWAHRALLVRAILGLDITVSYANPKRTAQGWQFDESGPYYDSQLALGALHQAYAAQRPKYTGRVTLPVLWDKEEAQILSNDSSDIVRMLATVYDPEMRLYSGGGEEIKEWNDLIYEGLNQGVYRAGFAQTQRVYEKAVKGVFATLDQLEDQLSRTRFLTGSTFSEADLRLFPTLARFDVAYHSAYKCNLRRLVDYPNLWAYARDIYQMPGVSDTVRFDIYKASYFAQTQRNPHGIIPLGPDVDWTQPANRGPVQLF
jgi:putative glutathione S-transferase